MNLPESAPQPPPPSPEPELSAPGPPPEETWEEYLERLRNDPGLVWPDPQPPEPPADPDDPDV